VPDDDHRYGVDEREGGDGAPQPGRTAVERDPQDREHREDAVAAARTAGGVAQHGDDDEAAIAATSGRRPRPSARRA
jgi:hypothetical protein